ncbi:hypothetical protein C4J81_00715 [Deltaproteobacteria bacterium Smac51]|nr:hypothetical protein C4J81_00715 [Deltaproteobacteria bacterium Smac51]
MMVLMSKSPTPEELWLVFPQICFPDLSAPTVTVTEEMISIHDPDSAWVVQSDIVMVKGGGAMTFSCQTTPTIMSIDVDETRRQWSLQEAVRELLPSVIEIYLVERGHPVWTFRGATDQNAKVLITSEINKIEWKYDQS